MAACGPSIANSGSSSGRSITCPWPPFPRPRAARSCAAAAPYSPAMRVGEVHRRQHRLAVGEAVDRGEARHALDQRAEARAAGGRARPVPSRRCARSTSFGLVCSSSSGRELHRLQRAGAEALDEHRRRRHQLQQQLARLGLAQVEAQALLVARVELPVRSRRPSVCQARSVSPAGGSTLITSAPKSPSTCVSVLPATRRERSSTRTPSSGAARLRRVVPLLQHGLLRLDVGVLGDLLPALDLVADRCAANFSGVIGRGSAPSSQEHLGISALASDLVHVRV